MLKQKKPGVWIQEEGTTFLVVDLDVFSRRRLSALAEAFGDRVSVAWSSRHMRLVLPRWRVPRRRPYVAPNKRLHPAATVNVRTIGKFVAAAAAEPHGVRLLNRA